MTTTDASADERDGSIDDVYVPRRTTWRDIAWLTWRRHRALIVVGAVVAAAVVVALLTYSAMLHHYAGCISPDDDRPGSCADNYRITSRNLGTFLRALVFLPTVGGAFCGAPLVARELETGTITLTLGQDVSVRRWLWSSTITLAAVLGLLGAAIGVAARLALPTLSWGFGFAGGFGDGFDRKVFETGPLTLAGYALAAGAIGVALGAVLRQALAAVPVAAAAFFPLWYLLRAVRPSYPSGHRVVLAQLIEAGLCVAVAAALIALTAELVRRRRGV